MGRKVNVMVPFWGVVPAVCGVLMAGSAVLVIADRVLTQSVLGASSSRWRSVFVRQALEFCRQVGGNAGTDSCRLRRMLTIAFLLTLAQGCCLPLFLPLSANGLTLLWMSLFQVQFVVDCGVLSLMFSLLSQLQLKRVIIRHAASQLMMVAVFLASMIVPLPNILIVRWVVLGTALIALMCLNGFGPFKFSLNLREVEPQKVPSRRDREVWRGIQMMKFLVSLGLAVNLSNSHVYSYCHLSAAVFVDFLVKLGVLAVLCGFIAPFFPPLRSDKYGPMFVRVWGPLASCLALAAILTKCWRGAHG